MKRKHDSLEWLNPANIARNIAVTAGNCFTLVQPHYLVPCARAQITPEMRDMYDMDATIDWNYSQNYFSRSLVCVVCGHGRLSLGLRQFVGIQMAFPLSTLRFHSPDVPAEDYKCGFDFWCPGCKRTLPCVAFYENLHALLKPALIEQFRAVVPAQNWYGSMYDLLRRSEFQAAYAAANTSQRISDMDRDATLAAKEGAIVKAARTPSKRPTTDKDFSINFRNGETYTEIGPINAQDDTMQNIVNNLALRLEVSPVTIKLAGQAFENWGLSYLPGFYGISGPVIIDYHIMAAPSFSAGVRRGNKPNRFALGTPRTDARRTHKADVPAVVKPEQVVDVKIESAIGIKPEPVVKRESIVKSEPVPAEDDDEVEVVSSTWSAKPPRAKDEAVKREPIIKPEPIYEPIVKPEPIYEPKREFTVKPEPIYGPIVPYEDDDEIETAQPPSPKRARQQPKPIKPAPALPPTAGFAFPPPPVWAAPTAEAASALHVSSPVPPSSKAPVLTATGFSFPEQRSSYRQEPDSAAFTVQALNDDDGSFTEVPNMKNETPVKTLRETLAEAHDVEPSQIVMFGWSDTERQGHELKDGKELSACGVSAGSNQIIFEVRSE